MTLAMNSTPANKRPLTLRQSEMIRALTHQRARGREWLIVMDLGGGDSTWHSGVLNQLVRRGLVERRRRRISISAAMGSNRVGYEYRLAPSVGRGTEKSLAAPGNRK